MYLTISRVKQSQISLSLAQKRPQKKQIQKKQRKNRHQFQGINSTLKINDFRAVYFLPFQNV